MKMLGAAVTAGLFVTASSAGAATIYKGNFLPTEGFVIDIPIDGSRDLKFVLKAAPNALERLDVSLSYELGGVRYENGQYEDYYMGHPTNQIASFGPRESPFLSIIFERPRPTCDVRVTGHCLIIWDEMLRISGEPNWNFTGRISYYVTAVPEPTTWALMIAGFGFAGSGLRRSRAQRQAPLRLQQAS